MLDSWYRIEDINPEPWTSPEAQVIRRGGKYIAVLHSGGSMRSYQEAVREEFVKQNGEVECRTDDLHVEFYFWRRVDSHEGERKSRANIADATNLQKSTEDALQGILFANDRQVKEVLSRIVEQDEGVEPLVMIHVMELAVVNAFTIDLAARSRTGKKMGVIGRRNFRKFEDEPF